jgi:hypothetical protein
VSRPLDRPERSPSRRAITTSAPVTGVEATSAVGTITVSGRANVGLTGAESTTAAGTPTVSGAANVTITGVQATGAAGTPTVSLGASAALTGVEAISSAGTPTVTGAANVSLLGAEAAGSAGTVTTQIGGAIDVTLVGVESVGFAGAISVTADNNNVSTVDTHDGFLAWEIARGRARRVRERAKDQDDLERELKIAFGLIQEAADELPPETVAEVAEIRSLKTAPAAVDWAPVMARISEVETILAAAEMVMERRRQDDEDDDLILLFAA